MPPKSYSPFGKGPAFICILLLFLFPVGVWAGPAEDAAAKWQHGNPSEWGERVRGIKTGIRAKGKEAALTFDACGGPRGSAVDEDLLGFLESRKIPATFFLSGRWVEKNRKTLSRLAANPLFEIGNHGKNHMPLSVTGKSAYGIAGTGTPLEAAMEIEENARLLEELTGRRTKFFRSGTNHYDETAVRIAGELGHEAVGYTLNGDGGATFSKAAIKEALLSAKGGEIFIFHMNRPEGNTAEALREAIPLLLERDFRFVRLSDRPLTESPDQP